LKTAVCLDSSWVTSRVYFKRLVPEFIDLVLAKTSPKRSFSVIQNERFGLVFATTGSIISGMGHEMDWSFAGICYLGDKPHSPNLSDLAECVILCTSWLRSPGKVYCRAVYIWVQWAEAGISKNYCLTNWLSWGSVHGSYCPNIELGVVWALLFSMYLFCGCMGGGGGRGLGHPQVTWPKVN
jgi:hypothetical protein